jgi:hypothetical protein
VLFAQLIANKALDSDAAFDLSHLGRAFLQASSPNADLGVMLLPVLMPPMPLADRLSGQDQFIELSQAQTINPSLMINFNFTPLLKQILAFDAERLRQLFRSRWAGTLSRRERGIVRSHSMHIKMPFFKCEQFLFRLFPN